jgi:hypothetical protein
MIEKNYYVRLNDIHLFMNDDNADILHLEFYKNKFNTISMKLDVNFNHLLLSGTDKKAIEKGFLLLLNNSKVGEKF